MGCWNATCMISGLPIIHGNAVVCFIISQNDYGTWGDETGCNAEANIVSHSIHGNYNDYGCVEDIVDCPENEILFEFLDGNMIPSPGHHLGVDTDNTSHHFKKSQTFSEQLECIERGYASLKDPTACVGGDKDSILTLTFILKDIWDFILAESDSWVDWGGNSIKERYRKMIREACGDYSEEQIEKYSCGGKYPREHVIEMLNTMGGSEHPLKRGENIIWNSYDPTKMNEEFALQLCCLHWYLNLLRINIRPQTGKGSQEENLEEHIKLYKKSIEMAEARLKDIEEWED